MALKERPVLLFLFPVTIRGQSLMAVTLSSRPSLFLLCIQQRTGQETLTSVFYTGDLLHLEASYSGPDAGHRRLFIDGCVAALSPDPRSAPRSYFIENHGCFNNAKEDGSNALFNPRTRSSSLQLQLDAFLFPHDTRNSVSHFYNLKDFVMFGNASKLFGFYHLPAESDL
ncbi:hypothetical protein KUCAC02_007384 [Chaenocephalus aceratus]|uniref:Uncharacterized protein n=1 Tax=Chaenocephalus aceratus TaxID=36190 RepID=A0ACB9X7D1_CHAAC|nr:hypothetical protein KUCAC02_007384 [Chaenocephalus aceratus]